MKEESPAKHTTEKMKIQLVFEILQFVNMEEVGEIEEEQVKNLNLR